MNQNAKEWSDLDIYPESQILLLQILFMCISC